MKKVILIILILNLSMISYAAERSPSRITFKDRFFGIFLKGFARAYVATLNMDKFKEKNIRKIRKMDETKFQKVYGKIYSEIKDDLPESIKNEFGVTEDMTREKAIDRILALSKPRMYKLINSIPSGVVAKQFRLHRQDIKKAKGNHTGDKQVDQFWNEVVGDALPSATL